MLFQYHCQFLQQWQLPPARLAAAAAVAIQVLLA
jgi:hypothetical protein